MKKMYMTESGVLVESLKEVFVSKDGEVFEEELECRLYEILGEKPFLPREFSFGTALWRNPRLDPTNSMVWYERVDTLDDHVVYFEVRDGGLFLKSVVFSDFVDEDGVEEDIGSLAGTPMAEIENADFFLV